MATTFGIDINTIQESYEAGIAVRDRLTSYSPVDMKALLDRIVMCNKHHSKMKAGEEYYDRSTLKVEYGGENGQNTPHINFILKEASLTWGYYDRWKAEINAIGIFLTFKPEHGTEEEIMAIGWNVYSSLINLFE